MHRRTSPPAPRHRRTTLTFAASPLGGPILYIKDVVRAGETWKVVHVPGGPLGLQGAVTIRSGGPVGVYFLNAPGDRPEGLSAEALERSLNVINSSSSCPPAALRRQQVSLLPSRPVPGSDG